MYSHLEPLNRSRRRQSALAFLESRWSGLTSAATRFMDSARRIRRASLALTVCLLGFLLPALGQQDPLITNTNHPMDTNVSAGAAVSFRVYANSAYLPMTYQWQQNGTNLPVATNWTLLLTNVTVAHAGGYVAWITNASGGVTNTRTAILTVDPTFVKITSGRIVTDREPSVRSSWCDYDGDGFQDLFVANQYNGSSGKNSLYHNNRDGTFTKITTNALSATADSWSTGTWADVDNDGDPDLYVGGAGTEGQAVFYRNEGGGRFTAVSIAPTLDAAGRDSWLVAWGDYDNDGWVDLFIPTGNLPSHRLFRNLGDLNFKSMTAAEVGDVITPSPKSFSGQANWIDYDNDNDLDLYIANVVVDANALCLNSGSGFFARTFEGSLANVTDLNWDLGFPSWADYENDGYLDAFISRAGFAGTLHHNLGGTNSVVVPQSGLEIPADNTAAIWGDYDNDGNLDLFLSNNPRWPYVSVRGANLLFRGNGDGTFAEVDVGSPIWEPSDDWDCQWIDYDNDGFLDLFIAAGPNVPEVNYLYRNNLPATGNTNHWLKVSLVGKASNAAGIGAKVRVTANIRGQTVTQLRAIESPGYIGSNQGLLAHFGLGDATNVTTLRIEWPSGIVQELHDVAVDQFLPPVVESQGYSPTNSRPAFTGTTKGASGSQLSFTEPAVGARYILEASTNLVTWTKLLARTSTGVATNYTDLRATNYPSRFYRLQVP